MMSHFWWNPHLHCWFVEKKFGLKLMLWCRTALHSRYHPCQGWCRAGQWNGAHFDDYSEPSKSSPFTQVHSIKSYFTVVAKWLFKLCSSWVQIITVISVAWQVFCVLSDRWLLEKLMEKGFAKSFAVWIGSNVKRMHPSREEMTWIFNVEDIYDMFLSYR